MGKFKNTVIEMYWLMLYGKSGVQFYINVKKNGDFESMKIKIPNTGMLKNNVQYHNVKYENYRIVFKIFQTVFKKDIYRGTTLVSKCYDVDTRNIILVDER